MPHKPIIHQKIYISRQPCNSPFMHVSSEDVGLFNNENVKKKLNANIEDNKKSPK